ncbi:ribbon-helix-helix protein, CopG family [Tritonibacter scottomollicae]|uniref:Ribbon-helix-helix CopG family protein n=1 Tax=Tritonibacter scottomollicae TaxID=483013 RepID=A0A2T1A346_TRISK|nr:ribbon-helix-helix protein, CopG family [Tritonibacter scottomollicae]PRZ42907.1 ribbon-helix-helix CopG family protein [Tritonibacter scottomollicae]
MSELYGTKKPKIKKIDCLMEKKRGRPSKDSEAVNLRLPRELLEVLDDRRRAEPDLPTRPEMIRRALVQWFELTQTRED